MTKEFNSSWQSKAELFITAQQKQFFNPPSATAEIVLSGTYLSEKKLLNQRFKAGNVSGNALQKTRLQATSINNPELCMYYLCNFTITL